MAHYYTSDVHLRLDETQRARRFADWVDRLNPSDRLTIVGDLCDFWFSARQSREDPLINPGLNALVKFRDGGGELTILAGNHDAWLGPLYERRFRANFVPDAMTQTIDGLRLRVAHGHRLKTIGMLKKAMESRAFLTAFGLLPHPVARFFESRLDASNDRLRSRDDKRQLDGFTRHASELNDAFDLVVLGHLHQTTDLLVGATRLIVLGSWHEQASYLRIEDGRATLVVEKDRSA